MKKTLYILAAALMLSSCANDLLEVPSQSSFDAKVVFSNYTLAEQTIFGIANTFTTTNGYRGRIHINYGLNTDVEWRNNHTGHDNDTAGRNLMAEYNASYSIGDMNPTGNSNPYSDIFSALERANQCIVGLRAYGNTANDKDMAHLLGEALTLRAFTYYELIKMWGDVPVRWVPVTNETTYIPKENRDGVYKQILVDLDEAAELLYWPNESTITAKVDRINKAFAKGLYARVALAASGYAYRTADNEIGTGAMGTVRLSNDEELSKTVLYPKALQHLKDVIGSGKASLYSSYENLWRDFNNSAHLNAGGEVLYVIPFNELRGRWNYHHAFYVNGNSAWVGNAANRGGDTGPVPTLWWKFGAQDVRRDLTVGNFQYSMEATKTNKGWNLNGSVDTWYWTKYRFDWMTAKPYGGGNDDGVKPIVMRYADVLLMAAEIGAFTGDSGAKGWLKEVRRRAYAGNEGAADAYVDGLSMGNATNGDYATSDYAAAGTFMKAIIDERALEFAGEMLRKADLIRWGLLKSKLDEASAENKALAEMKGAYAAYDAFAENKESDDKSRTFREYSVYWRPQPDASVVNVEVFGLAANEIGKTPADYSATEPNGWFVSSYISTEKFRGNLGGYKYDEFYKNEFNDPWPRSVWPIFGTPLNASQGAIVNDFGY